MKQRAQERKDGGKGDPRENPPSSDTSGTIPTCENPGTEWYQHDGCSADNATYARRVLDRKYPDSWIGRGGLVHWPARSPDLSPCKSRYSNNYRENAGERMVRACNALQAETLEESVLTHPATELLYRYRRAVIASILVHYRTPCMTSYSKVGQRECEDVNCCWNFVTKECYHSIPARHAYLWSSSQGFTKVVANMDLDLSARLSHTPLLTSSYPRLRALLRFVSRSHLRIIIGTAKSALVTSVAPSNTNDSDMEVYIASPAFTFEVYRKDGNSRVPLISSTRSPLVASVNYWEIGLRCPPEGAAYGLGGLEPRNTTLLYSSSSRSASFPYFMCLSPDGKAHGIMIRNSGPVEVSFVKKSKLFVLRALSNSGWDINILSGPKPGDVVNQLTELFGKPKLPPYWVLGFHVCRDLSDGMNSTNLNTTVIMHEFLMFLNNSVSRGLPYDSDCIHERLLNHLNFSASADVLSQFTAAFDSLRANGKKFLLSLPPQVAEADDGSFVRMANGSLYEGEYRDRKVAYPDFTNPNSSRWMASSLQILMSAAANMSSVLAGFVLADNWPEDVSLHDTEQLPYLPAVRMRHPEGNVIFSNLHL
ncbi:hypothetical protein PR048_016165 [Dryococelus australis]|uniref:Glycoside hydrolase family 31 TIM barrel domain-containing protein n=1 Tax=Dryococelus australis TaxID=614101 RepID=A0ABQ9HIZ3_9NEOP|nr:hypothetical protein PR048_016165 [Dryococelus australis]